MSKSKRTTKVPDPNYEGPSKVLLDPCRFNLPAKKHDKTHVDKLGYIIYARNQGLLNKFNPVISSALYCNNDISFTGFSYRILAFIFYITNYATKCETTFEKYAIALGIVKEISERDAAAARAQFNKDIGESNPVREQIPMMAPPLNKFILKAYNRFTRTLEVGAPAVARYLKGHKPYYTSPVGKIINLHTVWLVLYVQQKAEEALQIQSISSDYHDTLDQQYQNFKPGQKTNTIYEDYQFRGNTLRHLCFYEYCAQIEKQKMPKRPNMERQYYQLAAEHPQFESHLQTSIVTVENLAIPCIQGSLIGPKASESDTHATIITEDANQYMSTILLSLFVPLEDICRAFKKLAAEKDITNDPLKEASKLWADCSKGMSSTRLWHANNVTLLRRSKEEADRERKAQEIAFDEYLEETLLNEPENFGPEDNLPEMCPINYPMRGLATKKAAVDIIEAWPEFQLGDERLDLATAEVDFNSIELQETQFDTP